MTSEAHVTVTCHLPCTSRGISSRARKSTRLRSRPSARRACELRGELFGAEDWNPQQWRIETMGSDGSIRTQGGSQSSWWPRASGWNLTGLFFK